jgi:hypothetical protein
MVDAGPNTDSICGWADEYVFGDVPEQFNNKCSSCT